MSTEIVKIKASDYGLEETKAKEIESMFTPMMSKMSELENEYNNILKLDINPETCQMAKDLRLAYVKIRTGTSDIHKQLKAFYLAGGRFVDAFKNTQAFASGEKEESLKKIEKHFEILEAERKEKLKQEREKLISSYMEEVNTFSLGEMSEEVWQKFFAGAKLEFETRVAAEKKAEEDRIAKEKADAEAREKQRLENIRLQKEAKAREKEIAAEREKVRKENEEKERLAEIERKKNAAILKEQQDKADKERAELLAKAETERKEKERLEKEIADKKAIEEKRIRDAELQKQAEEKARKDAEKKSKLAPDKEKLLNFMQSINDLPRPEVKSIEAAEIASQVNALLVEVSNFIKERADKL